MRCRCPGECLSVRLRRAEAADCWSSARQFLFATAGATVGLGSFWRFPGLVAEYGGGAFLVVYLCALFVVGIPLLVAEWLPARRTHAAPPQAYRELVRESHAARPWRWLPWLIFASGFVVLVVLGVVASWVLVYLVRAIEGTLAVDGPRDAGLLFDGTVRDPGRLLLWQAIFLGSIAAVSAWGVRPGIERATRILLPLLLTGLVTLLLLAANSGMLDAGLEATFSVDFSLLGWSGTLAALGQAALTFALGVGAMHAYAAYQVIGMPLPRLALQLALFDCAVVVAASVAVCALLATPGKPPASGFELLFAVLPVAAGALPAGAWVAGILLACILMAGWLTALALLEPLVQWRVTRRSTSRGWIAFGFAALAWSAGAAILVPYAEVAGAPWSGRLLFEQTVLISGRVLVPGSVLLGALFVAWWLPDGSRRNEMLLVPLPLYRAWVWTLRYAAIPLLVLVILSGAGILGTPGTLSVGQP
jgi:NSS family neurotransmitter:Na+ symporter